MRAKRGVAVTLLLLAACSNGAGNASNGAAGNQAAQSAASGNAAQPVGQASSGPPEDLAGARALIDSIYQPYTRGQIPQTGRVYAPELALAIARQSDTDTGLGYDPFCRCQDFENFRYRIEALEPGSAGVTARVAIENMGERHVLTILLVRRGPDWKVYDISEGGDSLLAAGQPR